MEISIIPNAVGPGMSTPAGSGPNRSGGAVIHVTTLAPDGVGSLRRALETKGPRIVIFDVSGYIELRKTLKIEEPYLTIAGQTAPFPGITIKGAGLRIKTHDVLIQHIRARVGDNLDGPDPKSRDALSILGSPEGTYNIIVDHVSMSWAVDENLETWYEGVYDVSITNSIISEALWHSIHPKGPHSKGAIIGSGIRKFLMLGNLLAHNDQRNILVGGDTSTVFVNNVVYNWHGAGSQSNAGDYYGGVMDASIVGNVYIRGLDNRLGNQTIPIQIQSSVAPKSRFYIKDNEAIERSDDPWSVVRNLASDSIRVDISPNWPVSLIAKKGNVVKNWVLDHAGARRSDGEAVDLRIINDVKNGTGRIIDSQNDVGGWPPLAENVRGTGGNLALFVPSNEIQASGYTKIEEWLHHLAAKVQGGWEEMPIEIQKEDDEPIVIPTPTIKDGLLPIKKYIKKYITKVKAELKLLQKILKILQGDDNE